MSLTPRGMSIQEAYRLYAEHRLSVNRRYQRKLVWSEQEKQHLIDSIEQELPVPLFMLAKSDADSETYEIIDGMQRLNAIFSFIEHQFVDEKGECFDLEQFNRSKLVRDEGVFTEFEKEIKRIKPDACARFLEYQLAITIDTDGGEERINEVFGRINSGGRMLSPQEQRQAGLVCNFSEFIRKLAYELRGDDSPDILLLNEMPEVSFNTPREKQRYGIDAAEVFWCKHGIMTAKDLARSEDEQILADFAISLLNKSPLNASREVFDSYFNSDSDEFKTIHAALLAYGQEKLKNELTATICAIRAVFESDDFVSFRNCVQAVPRNPARTTFFAVFITFHDLIFKRGMYPFDNAKIRSALEDSQKLMIRSAHHSTTDDRDKNISIITGLIQDAFVKRDITAFGNASTLIVELENSLRRSKFEASRYEFKLGVCELGAKQKIDEGMYAKLGRTACAIANTQPKYDGYIYLGVADKVGDAERVKKLFGTESIMIGEVYFVGLEHDLQIMGLDIDGYLKKLINGLSKLPISQDLRTQLVTEIDHAEYKGRPFVRLRVPPQAELSQYDDEYPVRKNSETVNLTPAEAVSQSKLF